MKSGILPVDNYWLSCDYGEYNGHTGIDIGFNTTYGAKVPVWAWRDGVVVHVGYDENSRGNYISLRHDYDNDICQYTQYLHLDKLPTLKEGDEVKQGDEIGIRGGTPKYGVHLHFALTKETNEKDWSVQQIANNSIDSKPYLYKGDKDYHLKCDINPDVEMKTPKGFRRDFYWLNDKPYPEDVKRDEYVDQYEVTDTIHWRRTPSTDEEAYKYNVNKGIYNIKELVTDNNLTWVKVDDDFYFCGFNNGLSEGYGKYYPKKEKENKTFLYKVLNFIKQLLEIILKGR